MDTSQADPKRLTVPEFLDSISSDLRIVLDSTIAMQKSLDSPTNWTFPPQAPSPRSVPKVPPQTREMVLRCVLEPDDIRAVNRLLDKYDAATQSYDPKRLIAAANDLKQISDHIHVDTSHPKFRQDMYGIESYFNFVQEAASKIVTATSNVRFVVSENLELITKMQSIFGQVMTQYASGQQPENILFQEFQYTALFLKHESTPAHYASSIRRLKEKAPKLVSITNEGLEREEPIWGSCLGDILFSLDMWEPIDPNEAGLFYNNDARLSYLRTFVEYWLVDAEAVLTLMWINQEPLPIRQYEPDWIELPLGKPMLSARHSSITNVFVDPQFIRPDWQEVEGPFFQAAANYLKDRLEWAISSKKIETSRHAYRQKALDLLHKYRGQEIRSMSDFGMVLAALIVVGAVVSRKSFNDLDEIKGIHFVENYQGKYHITMSSITSISVLFSFDPEILTQTLEQAMSQLKASL